MQYRLDSLALQRPSDGDIHCDIPRSAWLAILRLAEMGGWRPAGTIEPPGFRWLRREMTPEQYDRMGYVPWHGGYRLPDGQTVTAADASRLANAVEKMLNRIRAHGHKADDFLGIFVSDEMQDAARKFIAFLRLGAFTINNERKVSQWHHEHDSKTR